MKLNLKNSIHFLFFITLSLCGQDIVWSTRLMDYNKKFESNDNYQDMAIGAPSIYPDTNIYGELHPLAEGYVLPFIRKSKLNMLKVGFNEPIVAQQFIIGGIFNPGTIYEVNLILEDKKSKKNVYKFNNKFSLLKFHDFSVFFEPTKVFAVEIIIQHQFIQKWNIIKGFGLTYKKESIDLVPYQVNLDPTKIKKISIMENILKDGCMLFSPEINSDGTKLYFVKECKNSKTGQDICYAERDEFGIWSSLRDVGKPLINNAHNYVASIGANDNFLLVGNKYNSDGSFGGDGVSRSYRTSENNWSLPQAIEIPNYVNYNDNVNYFLSSDEKYLIFAAEDDNSLGDLDLYVSVFNERSKKWSNPIHMNNTINTPFSEDYPYLSVDGKTMYFSSKGHIGYGGHDLYMTKRLDDTWTNWTIPVNLGPLINTPLDDRSFMIASDGVHAYLNSSSTEEGGSYIYKLNLPVDFYQMGAHNVVKMVNLKTPMKFEVK